VKSDRTEEVNSTSVKEGKGEALCTGGRLGYGDTSRQGMRRTEERRGRKDSMERAPESGVSYKKKKNSKVCSWGLRGGRKCSLHVDSILPRRKLML